MLRFLLGFKLRINDLVELHERSDKLFTHHLLDLSGCVVQAEVVDLVLPLNPFRQALVNRYCCSELVCKDMTEFWLVNVHPERFIVPFFVLFLEQFVEMIETDYFNPAGHLAEKVHEMSTTQHTAIIPSLFFIENLL